MVAQRSGRHDRSDGGLQRRPSRGAPLPGPWPAAAVDGRPVCCIVPQKPYGQERPQRCRGDRHGRRQGNMRFVPVKTVDQQARLSWHRVREGYKAEALATSNRLRGLLAEFGVAVAQSDAALRRTLADLDALALPCSLVELLRDADLQWKQLQARILEADKRIRAHAQADEACTRLRAIIGVGPITADAVVATIGSAQSFANGRQFAAWLGLVPMPRTHWPILLRRRNSSPELCTYMD